jgi:Zn-dependent protease
MHGSLFYHVKVIMNIQSATFLVWFITIFFAYLFTITLVGWFRAWVSKTLGDSTAELQGYLSLNPLVHIDPVGLITLLFFSVGWGQQIPINPYNLHAPRRTLKLIGAFFSGVCMHFALAIMCIVLLLVLYDSSIIPLAHYIIKYRVMNHLIVAGAYPQVPSLLISVAFMLIALVYLNLILGVLSLIMNGSTLGLLWYTERSPSAVSNNPYIVVGLPILLLLFFYDPLQEFGLFIITCGGYFIAKILHIG